MLKRNVLLTLLAFSVLGVPAYFLAFLFSYGFQDSAGVEDHAEFLVLVAAVPLVCAASFAAAAWRADLERVSSTSG